MTLLVHLSEITDTDTKNNGRYQFDYWCNKYIYINLRQIEYKVGCTPTTYSIRTMVSHSVLCIIVFKQIHAGYIQHQKLLSKFTPITFIA